MKTQLIVTFFFLFCHLNAYSQEDDIQEGGQKVEKVSVEQIETDEVKKAKEILSLEDEESEEELVRDAQASDVVGERPDPKGTPTKVKIGLFVRDISLMDDAEQTFTAQILLVVRWFDPRLADDSAEIRKLPVDTVWNPLINIDNEREVSRRHPENVFVQSSGHVLYVQKLYGTFTVPLNLRDFPLDKHRLYLNVRSFYPPEEVQLIVAEDFTGWSDTLSIPDWIVSDGEARVNAVYSKLQNREQSQFVFDFKIKRRIGFYLWKIILPLALIVIISWGVFWIQPHRLEAQVSLSTTTFLTLFAFQFAIAALLPRIAYLTRMDRYTMLCSLLVFLAILKAILTSNYLKDREELNLSINRYARVLFPLAFLMILVFSFWL